jgi:hypothetical protein
MNHRRQAAFHVRRAATEQICAFYTWLKLIAALRGNHIVVTAEIERSRAGSNRREYTRTFPSQIVEAESVQFFEESPGAFLVLVPWWIFRWNRDQPLREIQHRGLGKPFA